VHYNTLEGRLRVNKDLSKKEKRQEDPLKRYKRALEAFYAIKWRKRWLKSQKGRAIARYRPYPTKEALELYKDRAKAHCSILIQLRTEKIGLKAFLKGRRVPGYEDSTCECQEEEETVQHFLLRCQRWRTQREEILGPLAQKPMGFILGTRTTSQKAIEFLLSTKRLEQFQAIASTTII